MDGAFFGLNSMEQLFIDRNQVIAGIKSIQQTINKSILFYNQLIIQPIIDISRLRLKQLLQLLYQKIN